MDALLTVVGLGCLVLGAEVMIRGAVALAFRARITPLVVGLTVVSMGTSVPELLVSLLAALKGSTVVAVGNVVGSNIVNISFILGASVFIFPIEVDRESYRIHWPVMMVVSLAFVMLFWDDVFSRWEGAGFVAMLVAYVWSMVHASRKKSSVQGSAPAPHTLPLWRSLLMLVLGIGALGIGANWFVEGAVGLARTFGVSEQMIGVTIVAVGTSLPELITSLMAAFRKQPDISLGNLIGSNIFNLLGIIGITAIVYPIGVDHSSFLLDLGAMLLVALILYPLMRRGRKLGRWQGLLLMVCYVAYMVFVVDRG
jgi:cation:H+ antiporter